MKGQGAFVSLLAEELVEEWLNRQGYFTIRGVHIGVHEIDLLAVKPGANGLDCRHLEVQASVRPVSYITRVPRSVQSETGRAPNSAKARLDDELRIGISEWIEKKYDHPSKIGMRNLLASGPWSRELIIHETKFSREVELIQERGIVVRRLADVLTELKRPGHVVQSAAGGHLADLVNLTVKNLDMNA